MQAVGVGGLRQFKILPNVRGGLAAVVVVEILPDQLVGVLVRVPGELQIEPGEQVGPRAAAELRVDPVDAAITHEPQVFRHIEDRRPFRPVGIPVPDSDPIRGDLRPVPDRPGVVAVGGARGNRTDLVAGGILAPGARHDIDPQVFMRHERLRCVERLEVGERDHPGFGVGLLDDLHRLVEGQDQRRGFRLLLLHELPAVGALAAAEPVTLRRGEGQRPIDLAAAVTAVLDPPLDVAFQSGREKRRQFGIRAADAMGPVRLTLAGMVQRVDFGMVGEQSLDGLLADLFVLWRQEVIHVVPGGQRGAHVIARRSHPTILKNPGIAPHPEDETAIGEGRLLEIVDPIESERRPLRHHIEARPGVVKPLAGERVKPAAEVILQETINGVVQTERRGRRQRDAIAVGLDAIGLRAGKAIARARHFGHQVQNDRRLAFRFRQRRHSRQFRAGDLLQILVQRVGRRLHELGIRVACHLGRQGRVAVVHDHGPRLALFGERSRPLCGRSHAPACGDEGNRDGELLSARRVNHESSPELGWRWGSAHRRPYSTLRPA